MKQSNQTCWCVRCSMRKVSMSKLTRTIRNFSLQLPCDFIFAFLVLLKTQKKYGRPIYFMTFLPSSYMYLCDDDIKKVICEIS
jgi:hypothetical protein